jgi:queuine tRNA-ribosyltransferase
MPVGTQAAVRGQTIETLARTGSRILLANTYHLWRRPGLEVFRKFGGIHAFMRWGGPVLTDSGGYQIFSLPHARQLTEEGARFRPHPDAPELLLTPELSIEIQRAIGSDIRMALDECVPSVCERDPARAALERTTRWARRSLDAHRADPGPAALFGIVQGACFEDLRLESAQAITELRDAEGRPFDGFAVGGLAVGEGRPEREAMTEAVTARLPADRPRYLMGVGTPIDLLEAVHRGVDLFDCILPTAFAQQGAAFTAQGRVDLRRGVYRLQDRPLDADCDCRTCATYSRAYLHHLIRAREVLGWQLVGEHNLMFYHRLTARMRAAILAGRFTAFHRAWRERLAAADLEHPPVPTPRGRRRPGPPARLGDHELMVQEGGRGATDHAPLGAIKHLPSGEVMHAGVGAEAEARALYVAPARLAERLAAGESLTVWDVGLGAAANAMAALRAAEAVFAGGLELVSFERDLDPLRLALAHPERFPYLKHRAPHALLARGEWSSPDSRIRWRLLAGDFLARLSDAPAPDVIFHDPFSTRVDGPLWTADAFARIHAACRGRAATLHTYTASTRVRGALLAAGFHVRTGPGSGTRPETTIAFTAPAAPNHPPETWLPRAWLERWSRSSAREPAWDARLAAHPQFAPQSPRCANHASATR